RGRLPGLCGATLAGASGSILTSFRLVVRCVDHSCIRRGRACPGYDDYSCAMFKLRGGRGMPGHDARVCFKAVEIRPKFGVVCPRRKENRMDDQGRTVVITGGTGGLGTAVVDALIAAGAICHVPYRVEAEAQTLRQRGHQQVTLYAQIDLTDEDAVGRFYQQIPNLWASIHL